MKGSEEVKITLKLCTNGVRGKCLRKDFNICKSKKGKLREGSIVIFGT